MELDCRRLDEWIRRNEYLLLNARMARWDGRLVLLLRQVLLLLLLLGSPHLLLGQRQLRTVTYVSVTMAIAIPIAHACWLLVLLPLLLLLLLQHTMLLLLLHYVFGQRGRGRSSCIGARMRRMTDMGAGHLLRHRGRSAGGVNGRRRWILQRRRAGVMLLLLLLRLLVVLVRMDLSHVRHLGSC